MFFYLEVRDGTIKFTGKWLMNQLIVHLQPYMGYKCIVPCLGTLLYPRNGDLMKSLTLALYQSPYSDASLNKEQLGRSESTQHNPAAVLQEAGNVLNDLLLQEVRNRKIEQQILPLLIWMTASKMSILCCGTFYACVQDPIGKEHLEHTVKIHTLKSCISTSSSA